MEWNWTHIKRWMNKTQTERKEIWIFMLKSMCPIEWMWIYRRFWISNRMNWWQYWRWWDDGKPNNWRDIQSFSHVRNLHEIFIIAENRHIEANWRNERIVLTGTTHKNRLRQSVNRRFEWEWVHARDREQKRQSELDIRHCIFAVVHYEFFFVFFSFSVAFHLFSRIRRNFS